MSTTTGFRPDEAEFEPTATTAAGQTAEVSVSAQASQARELEVEALEAMVEGDWANGGWAIPAERATTRSRKRRRYRLSRKARLVRTGLVLLALEVTLSSFGVLPGHGWPLSLVTGHRSTAVAGPAASSRPTDAQASRETEVPGPVKPVRPALWAFAQVKGLVLYVPTHRLLGVGYHEASRGGALPITPLGRCVSNDNKGRIRTPKATAGPDYVILRTRYRAQRPTTAADVAMRKGTTVLAPISGRVVQVAAYRLYKYWLDYRVVIRPGHGSRLRVVMIHLTDLRVRKGQMVVAAVTPIGHPRVFPFRSDINDYVGPGVPHVHLEVKEIGPPRRKA
jgi:murein DD-endopeptidase MepM/ murein hydrolase activator NlpD